MRIALLAPVALPVPPQGYGGTELVISLLAEGLVRRGHEVTLFASGDSRTSAALRYRYPRHLEAIGAALGRQLTFVETSPEAFRESMSKFIPEPILKMLLD